MLEVVLRHNGISQGNPVLLQLAPGMSHAVKKISQGKEMLITKQVHIPKSLLAKPCNLPCCARL